MNSNELISESLAKDPRIAQAQQLIVDTVRTHQKRLTGVKPPDPKRRESYEELLKNYAQTRGSKLWFPYLGSGIGNGALVELLDGSVKYDFISGIGPNFLGHSHPALIWSSIDAAISDTVMQGNLQQNADAAELAQMLCNVSGLDHCFLCSSGAMANENALKMAFQKRHPANRVLAFEHCFAGRTLVLSQVTDKPAFRDGLPSTITVDYIPFYDEAHPEESTKEAVRVLKQHLSRHPKEYAAMIFELVQGENGFYKGTREFFITLMQILREKNVSIIVDEIQTFARTPSLFAFQHFGLEEFAEIVSIGKIAYCCAVLFRKEYNPRPGLLSQTFISSTAAIRTTITILHELMNGDYYGPNGKNQRIFTYFSQRLEAMAKKHPEWVHGPYGIGAMIAFTPCNGDNQRTVQLVHALFDAGLIGFVAGSNPTRVRFLLPFGVISTEDMDRALEILETTLSKNAW